MVGCALADGKEGIVRSSELRVVLQFVQDLVKEQRSMTCYRWTCVVNLGYIPAEVQEVLGLRVAPQNMNSTLEQLEAQS